MCDLRKKAHLQKSFKPEASAESIAKDAYYLVEIDDLFRRKYSIKA
jgi:hydroxymethylglutaryl-CoA synthase